MSKDIYKENTFAYGIMVKTKAYQFKGMVAMHELDHNSSKQLYKRLAVRFIFVLVLMLFILYGVPKLYELLFPFVFALIGAAIINPLADRINRLASRINKNIKIPRKTTTFVLNFLVLVLVLSLFYSLTYRIVKEVFSLANNILQNWSSIVTTYDEFLEKLTWNTSVLPQQVIDILEEAKDNTLIFVQNLSRNIVSFTVTTTTSRITSTGTFVINLITFFLALFFLSFDYYSIGETVKRYLDARVVETFVLLKNSVVNALGSFFKAQLILAIFAFVFMFLALTIYGQPYALIIALFLGIIDILPVIGTIAILLPWGVVEFVVGDLNKGIFLIIVGIAFFLIRKLVEPKVMGSQTGLPPLLVLVSSYVGLQFSGVWGALLGPVTLLFAMSIAKSGILNNTVADLKAVYSQVSNLLRGRE